MNPGPKFRIWDTKNNEWLGGSDPNTLTYYGFYLFGEVMTVQHMPGEMLGHIVIEQATGLKDRNGVEIYEGDIIKFEVSDKEYFRQVVNKHDYGCFMLTKKGETPYSFLEMYQMSVKEFEVVGNIHQDLELSEVK